MPCRKLIWTLPVSFRDGGPLGIHENGFTLPKHEEMEALRQELTGQLLEYQECKQVAAQLTERFNYNIYVREPAEVEPDKSYKRHHDPGRYWQLT